jgi:hypothetical protein
LGVKNPRTDLTEGTGMDPAPRPGGEEAATPQSLRDALSPYKAGVWRRLTPRERLRRSWQMRTRLPNPQAVHDRKLFPKP